MLSPHATEVLLSRLCIDLGFCLPPEVQRTLKEQPPLDAKAFADAVLLAEGLDPETADLHLYRKVKAMISTALRTAVDEESSPR
jgi:hypothetical protein